MSDHTSRPQDEAPVEITMQAENTETQGIQNTTMSNESEARAMNVVQVADEAEAMNDVQVSDESEAGAMNGVQVSDESEAGAMNDVQVADESEAGAMNVVQARASRRQGVKLNSFKRFHIKDKNPTDVPGIGTSIGEKMKADGITTADMIFGKYLWLNRDEIKFIKFMRDCGANNGDARTCFKAMKEFADNHNV